MNHEEVLEKIDALAAALASLRELVALGVPTLPNDAQKRYEEGVCLLCRKPLAIDPSSGQAIERDPVRGCHRSCHRTLAREIAAGKMTDGEAISRGFHAPKRSGGRLPADNPVKSLIREATEARADEIFSKEKAAPKKRGKKRARE